MKHIKTFEQINEAIIDYDHSGLMECITEITNELARKRQLSLSELSNIGNKYNVEFVNYDTFFNDLPESAKSTAPPKDVMRAPIFGLLNVVTGNVRIVVQIPNVDLYILGFLTHMLKHENIHVDQNRRRNIEYVMVDPKDKKAYFSDKNEIMAFSHSIADLLINMDRGRDINDCLSKINKNPLYQDIKKYVDEKTLKRYHKYIYLYLEMEFEKRNEESNRHN